MSNVVPTAQPSPLLRKLLGSRLLSALSYPRTTDRYVELAAPLYSNSELRAEVVAVKRETADVVTLVLRPSERMAPHRAGQYVALTTSLGGVRRTRCFSLSSAPRRGDGLVEITVKARPSGAVTPRLAAELLPGAVVALSQPQGEFVLPSAVPERLLFISGGSGITPVMAMLRSLVAAGHRGRVVFVHFARSSADVIFASELAALAASEAEWLTVVIETELESASRPDLSASSLASLVEDFEQWEAWVCGPEPLMAAARGAFEARGEGARVRTERFSLASAGTGGASAVNFRRSGTRADGEARPLLMIAEQAGLRPQSGCRMGICHTCKCRKIAGVTRDVRTGELSSEADVDIQLCVSEPVGEVTLDL
jgi:stearoyl-CoA 9-desaturase NADPH oxidoreductase